MAGHLSWEQKDILKCGNTLILPAAKGDNHLFLVNQQETKYFDCTNLYMPYGEQLVSDVVNRTETAMTQDHCFLATELALTAQKRAFRLNV